MSKDLILKRCNKIGCGYYVAGYITPRVEVCAGCRGKSWGPAVRPETDSQCPPRPDELAIEIATRYGGIEGDHHRAWVIDQMVRALLGDRYNEWVETERDGEWDEGIAP